MSVAASGVHEQEDNFDRTSNGLKSGSRNVPRRYRWEIQWHYVITFAILHAISVYGIYVAICGRMQFVTLVYSIVLTLFCGLGITAGAHRLWTHRTYKARFPLRVLLAAWQTMAYQFNIFKWVRDHRVHHKYTDTDADPHNSTRGFFFSHIGWLLVRKHPEVQAKLLEMDMRDVMADPVAAWQRKHYTWLGPLVAFVIPPLIPYFLWDEEFFPSIAMVGVFRHLAFLHITFSVNSVAHIWGTKPYDKNISSVENKTLALFALGEGWHNYHHAFPWDYKTAELGNYLFNFTTLFIDLCARLGLAYDLKTASAGLVADRCLRTGDAGVVQQVDRTPRTAKEEDRRNVAATTKKRALVANDYYMTY